MDLKNRIKQILVNNPKARESNDVLMASVWNKDIGGGHILDLAVLALSKLTSWDSATRAKRKLQEEHPELRGQSYNLRKAKANKVRKDVSILFGGSNIY
tara:strand:- start:2796 stop:3092 length:297 start_codon:yes stop_codon:yes gene_type:complete